MNCERFLKVWRRPGAFASGHAPYGRSLQKVMSLARLGGWWRRDKAKERPWSVTQKAQTRPVTPWSHGLF